MSHLYGEAFQESQVLILQVQVEPVALPRFNLPKVVDGGQAPS